MDCPQARELIERSTDEPLDAKPREALAAHLEACPLCAQCARGEAALLRGLERLSSLAGDDLMWRGCAHAAVAEGTARLRSRHDRRVVRRLAWAAAAVWVAAWLLGSVGHPPPPSGDAVPAVSVAQDAPGWYEDLPPVPGALPRAEAPPDRPRLSRRAEIERLLSEDEPSAEAVPEPTSEGPRAEVSNRV